MPSDVDAERAAPPSPELASVFPGQGAHGPGMLAGVRLQRGFAERWAVVAAALGDELTRMLERGDADVLNQNRVTALLTVLASAVSYDAFVTRNGVRPGVVAGYSVGQWSALYAAGVVTFEALVAVVAERSRLMDACFTERAGAMLAVIGLFEAPVEALTAELRAAGHEVWISNYNCAGQLTLAGTATAIAAAEAAVAALKPKKIARVPVSGAWHSPLLAPARAAFASYLAQAPLGDARVPVFDNVSGDLLPAGGNARVEALAAHLDHPVRWERCVRAMVARGATRFVEVGYGNMLTKFDMFIDRSVEHETFYPAV